MHPNIHILLFYLIDRGGIIVTRLMFEVSFLTVSLSNPSFASGIFPQQNSSVPSIQALLIIPIESFQITQMMMFLPRCSSAPQDQAMHTNVFEWQDRPCLNFGTDKSFGYKFLLEGLISEESLLQGPDSRVVARERGLRRCLIAFGDFIEEKLTSQAQQL